MVHRVKRYLASSPTVLKILFHSSVIDINGTPHKKIPWSILQQYSLISSLTSSHTNSLTHSPSNVRTCVMSLFCTAVPKAIERRQQKQQHAIPGSSSDGNHPRRLPGGGGGVSAVRVSGLPGCATGRRAGGVQASLQAHQLLPCAVQPLVWRLQAPTVVDVAPTQGHGVAHPARLRRDGACAAAHLPAVLSAARRVQLWRHEQRRRVHHHLHEASHGVRRRSQLRRGRTSDLYDLWVGGSADLFHSINTSVQCFFFFCVPQLYLLGFTILGEIFAYVTVYVCLFVCFLFVSFFLSFFL